MIKKLLCWIRGHRWEIDGIKSYYAFCRCCGRCETLPRLEPDWEGLGIPDIMRDISPTDKKEGE